MKDEDWALLNKQALKVTRLTLSRNDDAFNIGKETSIVSPVVALSRMYEKPSVANTIHRMMQAVVNLTMYVFTNKEINRES